VTTQVDFDVVRRLGQLTECIHAVVYFAPEARSSYESLGLRGYWRGYFASRCAAVGPIGPDLATALLGGFAPSMVARALPEVWSAADPTTIVAARARAATAALNRLFADIDRDTVAAAAELTARCVTALRLAGRPMAAAHRETPRPTDSAGALWHDTTVLREHRGDGHLAAVAAAGMQWPEPHLLIADRLDPAQQAHRGWSDEEWTEAAHRVRGRNPGPLDESTDRLAAPAYNAIAADDRLTLVRALTPLARAAAIELPFPNAMGLPLQLGFDA
jgi:hypothetical protein